MVCPRCIDTVKDIFTDLGIQVSRIQLGEVLTSASLYDAQKLLLNKRLTDRGFELLTDNKSRLIGQIKEVTSVHALL